VNSSGFRQLSGEAYPGPPLIARYRELGGRRVTAGSDSHASRHFAWGLEAGYRLLAAAGFTGLAFRRGADRATIEIPDRLRVPVPMDGPPNNRWTGSL
jgi:histidinol-phosphatase (PHP family)